MSIYDSSKRVASKLITKFANPDTLTFEQKVLTSDGMGGQTESWSTKFTCGGAVLPLSASEQLKAMQLSDETSHKAYIEHSSGTPSISDRLSFKGKIYDVTGVVNIAESDAVYTVYLKDGLAS